MGWIDTYILRRIAKSAVLQGAHRGNMIAFSAILIEAFRDEFTEDNWPTQNAYLTHCFTDALTKKHEQ